MLTLIGSAGGPIPSRGLVWGRGGALFRVVSFGGSQGAEGSWQLLLMLIDAADVFLYRDSSIAPLLDMRRRFKAVLGVLDAIFRYDISLAQSVELTAQWDRILAGWPFVSCHS